MKESAREYLRQQIKNNGLWETSHLLGLSMAQLLVGSKIKITTKYANEVLLDMIENGDIPTKYKEFTIENNGDGAVLWWGSKITDKFGIELKETIYIMATPLWAGNNMIPIDFDFYDLSTVNNNHTIFSYDNYGLYQSIITTREEFESLEKLLEWYRDFYLPTVYENIMTQCIPQVIDYTKEKIYDRIHEYLS